MSFEKGDMVLLHDKHSEFDGDVGEVTRVSETMFGDATYTVKFDGGQEAGLPADALEASEETDDSDDETDE